MRRRLYYWWSERWPYWMLAFLLMLPLAIALLGSPAAHWNR